MSSVQSAQPLYGTVNAQFNLGFPGPQNVIPDWVGHISINDNEYGIVFFNLGTGKSFDNELQGNVVFFTEQWVIYSSMDFQFNDQGVMTYWNHGPVLMSGDDTGIVSLANSNYHMNGGVQLANGLFHNYLGKTVHISGTVLWDVNGNPQFAPGQFRIN